MEELFLPVLSHFSNGNAWLASWERLRYKIVPDTEGATLCCEVWEGPWCYELSQTEDERVVPLSEEGLAALRPFLEQWHETVSARPVPTLAETVRRRDALLAQREKEGQ